MTGPLSENWLFRQSEEGEAAFYCSGSVSALVQEHDGRAIYEVLRHREVIASGGDPDLDGSIDAVEEVLVEIGWLYCAPTDLAEAA